MNKRKPAGPEEAFLDSIRANPQDETSLLVYADWLEERGDPRGEFVRQAAALGDADGPILQGPARELCQQWEPLWAATVIVPAQLQRLRRRIEVRFGPLADLTNRQLYRSRCLYPPATENVMTAAEQRLRFSLPPQLKAVYTHIGNGGLLLCLIGVRGGQTGFDIPAYKNKDIVSIYEANRIWGYGLDEVHPWPEGLLAIYDGLGCAMCDHVNCTTPEGPIWLRDGGELEQRLNSLEEYLHESVNKWSPGNGFKPL